MYWPTALTGQEEYRLNDISLVLLLARYSLGSRQRYYLRNLIVRSAIDQLLAPDREAQWLFTGIEQWSILIRQALALSKDRCFG